MSRHRKRNLHRTSVALLAALLTAGLAAAGPAAAQHVGDAESHGAGHGDAGQAVAGQSDDGHDADGHASAGHDADSLRDESRPSLALMGTIPLYWGEVESVTGTGFDALVSGTHHPHWARAVLEEQFSLWPLDYLSADALAGYDRLLMAQPRGLSPEENVALDAWVRGGGRLLLFADPAMTGHSHYHLGDRRRPQDMVLLSPILAHWGLTLQFDDGQPEGLRSGEIWGHPLPVNLQGTFVEAGEEADCVAFARGLAAQCRLGSGYALLIADAAMLDHDGPWDEAETSLADLTAAIFGDFRAPGASDAHSKAQDRLNSADSSHSHSHAEPAAERSPP